MPAFDAEGAARGVVEELAEHAEDGERTGRLAPASVETLRRSGMLSLWRPASLGGPECDPLAYAVAAEEIAAADTAAAWLMHGTSATWFDLRFASAELVDEIVASAAVPVLGETFNRPMQAMARNDGWVVTGETPFASGCPFADWIGHTALAGDRFLLVYHPRGALEVADDWDSLGMRGSASNTIIARETFVPRHRVIDLTAPGGATARFAGALYRMPMGIIPVAVAAVALGALRSALDATTAIAERRTPFAATSTLKHRAVAQMHFGGALATYRAARTYLHATIADGFACAERGDPFDLPAKADLFLAYAHTLQRCADAVRALTRAAGTAAIHRGSPLERALRDAEVVAHHAFGAEGRFATVAQAYWGLDVDFPLVAMD